jgi:uncharacterized protein
MTIEYDQAKRIRTLRERGLDFEDCEVVFSGPTFEYEDVRKDYGEERMICYGFLASRLVVVGYVQRGDSRHIFPMRKANEREIARYAALVA